MGIWEILGIAPTRDRSAIEEAYAQQCKFCDPQADPQNWRRLQEAYSKAMDHAGGAEAGAEEMPLSAKAEPSPVVQDPVSPEAEIAAGKIMAELETLYSNPGWRSDLQRWRAQLESERAYQEGVTALLRFQLFDFLSRQPEQEEPVLEPRVVDYLEHRLDWEALVQRFGEHRVHKVLGAPASSTGEPGVQEAGPEQAIPGGLGIALIGWVVALMILTIVFGELTGT